MFACINVSGITVFVGNGNAAPGMQNASWETQRQFVGPWWAAPVGGEKSSPI